MLRKWEERHTTLFSVEEKTTEFDISDDIPCFPTQKFQTETWKDVHIDELLTGRQKEEVVDLLMEFQDIFTDLPRRTDKIKHKIQLTGQEKIRQKPYRLPEPKKELVRKEIDQFLELGIIVESESSFASPIVLVPKKDQSTRMCIDFRKLNKISKFDAYPILRIDDLLEKVSKAHYISNLDFSKGCYQIPLSRQLRDNTAFMTSFGLYEFTVMPFGLASAPATFMRLMDRVLSGADAYFDDTSVFSHNWKAHIQHLRDVFTRSIGECPSNSPFLKKQWSRGPGGSDAHCF
jgi:hypothetical protein